MKVNLGGIIPLSTVDWTGRAAAVVFLRGCPLRCPHCHNSELQQGESLVEFPSLAKKIKSTINGSSPHRGLGQITIVEALDQAATKPMVSALVLSGGEPLMQPEQAQALLSLARSQGLKTGLETCGYYPEKLQDLLEKNLVDKLFLDIKACLREREYARATGREDVLARVKDSLQIAVSSGVPLEIRTTIFPHNPDPSEVREIAQALSALKAAFPDNGLQSLRLQQGRPRGKEFEPVALESLHCMAQSMADLVPVEVKGLQGRKTGKVNNSESLARRTEIED